MYGVISAASAVASALMRPPADVALQREYRPDRQTRCGWDGRRWAKSVLPAVSGSPGGCVLAGARHAGRQAGVPASAGSMTEVVMSVSPRRLADGPCGKPRF